jgi:hypothetical protein
MHLDDCIVYAKGNAQFLQRLRAVFERFHEKNLFFEAMKCKFCVKQIEYVGRVISREGLFMSANKITNSCT